jgi:hypothetical protein
MGKDKKEKNQTEEKEAAFGRILDKLSFGKKKV